MTVESARLIHFRALRLRRSRLRHRRRRQRNIAARFGHYGFTDHFRADRRDLHFAQPCADVGGEAGIGGDRRELGGLVRANADPGIGHQSIGGGDHVAGAKRGVQGEIDRRQA